MAPHPNHVHPRHKRRAHPHPYKPLAESVAPASKQRTGIARPAFTYRGTKRNLARWPQRAMWLARARHIMQMTRREFNRWRTDMKLMGYTAFQAWMQKNMRLDVRTNTWRVI